MIYIYVITALDFKTSPEYLGTPFLMHYVCACGLHYLDTHTIGFPSSKKRYAIVFMQLIHVTLKISHATANVLMQGKILQTNLQKSVNTHKAHTPLCFTDTLGKYFVGCFLSQKSH